MTVSGQLDDSQRTIGWQLEDNWRTVRGQLDDSLKIHFRSAREE